MIDETSDPKAPGARLPAVRSVELLVTQFNDRAREVRQHVVQLCSKAMGDGSIATLATATRDILTLELRTVRETHAIRLRFMAAAARLAKPVERMETLRSLDVLERHMLVHLRWLRDRRLEIEIKRSEVMNRNSGIPSIVIRSGREVRVVLRSIRSHDTKKD